MKTKMHCKSIFALLLVMVMVVSMIPAAALPVKAVEYTEGDSFYYSGFDDTSKWTRVNATIADGVATFTGSSARLSRSYSSTAVEKDFTLKFSVQMPNAGTTDGRVYIELGTGEAANSTAGIMFLGGHDSRTDRVRIYTGNTSSSSYADKFLTTSRAWHDIQIDVSPANGAFSVTVDGAVLAEGVEFVENGSFQSVYFRPYSGTVNIKNFEIYTSDMEGASDWTVTKQAALGENIGMTFYGKAGATTGIKSVRATVGTTVVTEAVGEDGAYSVTLPVAASQMAETITLEGLDAEGAALQTKTYTVAEYLAEVKASDEAAYGSIVDHTLNYGSAAAAYFKGAAVSAPSLTLSDVPNARKGDNITLKSSTRVVPDLRYVLGSAITDTYTVEFRYQLQNTSSNVHIKIGPDFGDTTANLWLRFQGDVYTRVYKSDGSYEEVNNNASADDTGVWHTFKVTVYKDSEDDNKLKFTVELDGQQVTTATYSTGEFPCINQNAALGVAAFDLHQDTGTARTMMIDDFKIYSGNELYYSDNFEAFTVGATANGEWVLGVDSTYTLSLQELENPVSGSCTGVTVNSANLLFEDQVKVRYKITLGDGNYTIKVNGSDPAKMVSAGGNAYYVYSEGINPQMYGEDVVLTVSDGTDTVAVNYSALDYIQRMYEKGDTSAELKTLLKAMYNYYQAANTYLAN